MHNVVLGESMNKCLTCRYWDSDTGQIGTCLHYLVGNIDLEDDLQSGGLYIGTTDDYPVVLTDKDFACCHFEEKK